MDIEQYRGWEIYHDKHGLPVWDAYRGGADIDAVRASGDTFEEIKAEIDDYEEERA